MAGKIGPLVLLGGIGALALLGAGKARAKREEDKIDIDPNEVPKIKGDQVAFSANFENYKVGAQWRIQVLEKYLNDARKAGELAYEDWKQAPKEVPHPWIEEMVTRFGWDWDKPGGRDLNVEAAFQTLLAETRLEVLNRFKDSHYAVIPGGAAPLSALPKTVATDEFNAMISEYSAGFQRLDFPAGE